jgi:hypothetical protein
MTVFMCVGGALLGLAIGIDSATTPIIACHFSMTVFMSVGGALLGLPIGMTCSWVVLDRVAQSWEARLGGPAGRLLAPLDEARRERALLMYGIPLVFALVGAATGYIVCMGLAL